MHLITRFPVIIFIALVSCKQGVKTEQLPDVIKVVDSVQDMVPKMEVQTFSLDEFYQSYINEDLQSYIVKTHPAWSVPNQSLWYPQLFNKYKTRSSLVNYIQGDFDCNGKTDYALIVDKGQHMLAAVAFLSFREGFRTAELTELGKQDEKINYVLTLYKPGRYDISDPDLHDSDLKFVNLKCSSVGIGHFKELYDGGDDVFYWQQGELRSFVIEKEP